MRFLASSLVLALLWSTAPALGALQGPLQPPPEPDGNPLTQAKADLGKALFWDEQLSSTRTVACGTCHVFAAGGADPRSRARDRATTHPGLDGILGTDDDAIGSAGVPSTTADFRYHAVPAFGLDPQVTPRLAPAATDAGYARELFWDGRAGDQLVDPLTGDVVLASGAALEVQSLAPLLSPVEMGHAGRTWQEVTDRVEEVTPLALASDVPTALSTWLAGRGYPELFAEAFGDDAVTPTRIAMALASYERTLVGNETPLDLELGGTPALTEAELRGRALFESSRTDCGFCHVGNRLTNDAYHNLGVRPPGDDLGRYLVSGFDSDRGRFRTPSLRGAALRPAYMHDGSLSTLAEVVDFYDRGGNFTPVNRDPLIRPLNLSPAEKADLVAFLSRPLVDPRMAAELPPFDRPTLYTETDRVPRAVGAGTPGQGGVVPRAVALEPPSITNPRLTVALANGRQGAPAVLALDVAADPVGRPLAGATVHLALSPALTLLPVGVLVGPGPGHASRSFDLTRDPALAGVSFAHQWFVFDPAAPNGPLAASAAVELTLF